MTWSMKSGEKGSLMTPHEGVNYELTGKYTWGKIAHAGYRISVIERWPVYYYCCDYQII